MSIFHIDRKTTTTTNIPLTLHTNEITIVNIIYLNIYSFGDANHFVAIFCLCVFCVFTMKNKMKCFC